MQALSLFGCFYHSLFPLYFFLRTLLAATSQILKSREAMLPLPEKWEGGAFSPLAPFSDATVLIPTHSRSLPSHSRVSIPVTMRTVGTLIMCRCKKICFG